MKFMRLPKPQVKIGQQLARALPLTRLPVVAQLSACWRGWPRPSCSAWPRSSRRTPSARRRSPPSGWPTSCASRSAHPLILLVVAAYLAGFVLHAVAIWLLPLYLAQAAIALSLPVTAVARLPGPRAGRRRPVARRRGRGRRARAAGARGRRAGRGPGLRVLRRGPGRRPGAARRWPPGRAGSAAACCSGRWPAGVRRLGDRRARGGVAGDDPRPGRRAGRPGLRPARLLDSTPLALERGEVSAVTAPLIVFQTSCPASIGRRCCSATASARAGGRPWSGLLLAMSGAILVAQGRSAVADRPARMSDMAGGEHGARTCRCAWPGPTTPRRSRPCRSRLAGDVRRPGARPTRCLPTPTRRPASGGRPCRRPGDARNRVLVALERNRVVGFAVTVPASDPDCDPVADAELSELTIDPRRARQGPRLPAAAGRGRHPGRRPVHPRGVLGDRPPTTRCAGSSPAPAGPPTAPTASSTWTATGHDRCQAGAAAHGPGLIRSPAPS